MEAFAQATARHRIGDVLIAAERATGETGPPDLHTQMAGFGPLDLGPALGELQGCSRGFTRACVARKPGPAHTAALIEIQQPGGPVSLGQSECNHSAIDC